MGMCPNTCNKVIQEALKKRDSEWQEKIVGLNKRIKKWDGLTNKEKDAIDKILKELL